MKNRTLNIKNFVLPIFRYYLIKMGINFSKSYIYSTKLDNIDFKEPKIEDLTIKVCKIEDAELFGKLKDEFSHYMQNGHILIAAFLNEDWVGYAWISLKPVKVEELDRFIHFDGAYLWKGYVKKDFRNKGIAKGLLSFSFYLIKTIYKKNRAYTLVETSNIPSIRSLEGSKFSRIGTIKYDKIFLWRRYAEELDDDTLSFLEEKPVVL
jgi:GNAT superfamily N-acetyltransferase